MTDQNWQMVYSSQFDHKVEIVHAILKDMEIDSVIVNKKDSAYLFGEIELYVHPDNVLKAKRIIKTESL